MATGKPPWEKLKQLDIIFAVCRSGEVPCLPKEFSDDARNFVSLCFRRNPMERPNVCELLQHPFICSNNNPEFFRTDSTKFLTDMNND